MIIKSIILMILTPETTALQSLKKKSIIEQIFIASRQIFLFLQIFFTMLNSAIIHLTQNKGHNLSEVQPSFYVPHLLFSFTFSQVVHENLYNIKIRSYFLFLRKKMIFFYWLDLLLRSSRKKTAIFFFFCNCCFCMTLQQNILTIFASFCVRKYHGFCNIYMYTFFVFSKN